MVRFMIVALVAGLLAPDVAEAKRLRFGGKRPDANVKVVPVPTGVGIAAGAVLGSRAARSREPQQPNGDLEWARMRTAPALPTQPATLQGPGDAQPKIWCQSAVVVGGFCVIN